MGELTPRELAVLCPGPEQFGHSIGSREKKLLDIVLIGLNPSDAPLHLDVVVCTDLLVP